MRDFYQNSFTSHYMIMVHNLWNKPKRQKILFLIENLMIISRKNLTNILELTSLKTNYKIIEYYIIQSCLSIRTCLVLSFCLCEKQPSL